MKKIHRNGIFLIAAFLLACYLVPTSTVNKHMYLYKIMSKADWEQSQKQGCIVLQPNDDAFIHLSEKEQIDRIVNKYWAGRKDIYIAEINPYKVHGTLVQEANPGGTTKYYHLYDGKIPLDAVIDAYPYRKR